MQHANRPNCRLSMSLLRHSSIIRQNAYFANIGHPYMFNLSFFLSGTIYSSNKWSKISVRIGLC